MALLNYFGLSLFGGNKNMQGKKTNFLLFIFSFLEYQYWKNIVFDKSLSFKLIWNLRLYHQCNIHIELYITRNRLLLYLLESCPIHPLPPTFAISTWGPVTPNGYPRLRHIDPLFMQYSSCPFPPNLKKMLVQPLPVSCCWITLLNLNFFEFEVLSFNFFIYYFRLFEFFFRCWGIFCKTSTCYRSNWPVVMFKCVCAAQLQGEKNQHIYYYST